MSFLDKMGARVKKARKNSGLGQAKLARLAGISNDYMNKIETGKQKNLGTEVIEALAGALDVHPSILLFGKIIEPDLSVSTDKKAPELNAHQKRIVAKLEPITDKKDCEFIENLIDRVLAGLKK